MDFSAVCIKIKALLIFRGTRWRSWLRPRVYKLTGRGFDPQWDLSKFSLTSCFRRHCGPRIDSASNRRSASNTSWGVKAAGWYG